MKESSRFASLDDLESLYFLRKEAISELKNKRGGEVLLNMESFSEDSVEKFSYWFKSADHRVFAGLFGDAVVALSLIHI